jgi:hypothetical protein
MTAQEYEEMMNVEASSYQELDELQNNSSQVAFWIYVKKIVAFLAAYIDLLLQRHKQEVIQLIDTTETGHIDWYIKMIREFQYGDQLVIINNVPTYSVINESNQIIARVAYNEVDLGTGFQLQFKVVKEDSGDFVPLELEELSALSVYVNRRKIPGTWIEILSLPADIFKIECEVYLDPLVFNADGSLIASPTTFPFIDGMNHFFKTIDFGGRVYNSEMIEQIVKIEGIVDFYINVTSVGAFNYIRSFQTESGYVFFDVENSDITYVLP